jgi:hypothetical protein
LPLNHSLVEENQRDTKRRVSIILFLEHHNEQINQSLYLDEQERRMCYEMQGKGGIFYHSSYASLYGEFQ